MSDCEKLLKMMTIDACPADDAQLQEHAARCSQCRDQLLIDGDLRQLFHGIAPPAPSLHFNRALRQRLRAEGERQRRRRWRLVLMQAYWVAAGVTAPAVLMLVRWPSEVPSVSVLCALGAVFGTALLAVVSLFLSLRTTPLGLLADTVDAFRR